MIQYKKNDINLIKMMLDQMVVQGISQAKLLVSIDSILEKGKEMSEEEREEGEKHGSR